MCMGVMVLVLLCGGVLVGLEVVFVLDVLLDVFVVWKFGVFGYEEFVMGVVVVGGFEVFDEFFVERLGIMLL